LGENPVEEVGGPSRGLGGGGFSIGTATTCCSGRPGASGSLGRVGWSPGCETVDRTLGEAHERKNSRKSWMTRELFIGPSISSAKLSRGRVTHQDSTSVKTSGNIWRTHLRLSFGGLASGRGAVG